MARFASPLVFALLACALPARADGPRLVEIPRFTLAPPALLIEALAGGPVAQAEKRKGKPPPPVAQVGALGVGARGVSPMGKALGIGLELGVPVSLTLKYMLTPDQGLVGGLGAFGGPFFNTPTLSVYGDYLWHPHVLLRLPPLRLSWFIGGGGWVVIGDRLVSAMPILDYYGVSFFAVGARLPIGLHLAFNELPLELYVQAVPSLFIFPGLSGWIGGSLGFRFYF